MNSIKAKPEVQIENMLTWPWSRYMAYFCYSGRTYGNSLNYRKKLIIWWDFLLLDNLE